MLNPAKRIILQGLNRAGYRLLKREEHERLLATAAGAQHAAQAPQSDISPSPLRGSVFWYPDYAANLTLNSAWAVGVPTVNEYSQFRGHWARA
jgi:hypothetical protein